MTSKVIQFPPGGLTIQDVVRLETSDGSAYTPRASAIATLLPIGGQTLQIFDQRQGITISPQQQTGSNGPEVQRTGTANAAQQPDSDRHTWSLSNSDDREAAIDQIEQIADAFKKGHDQWEEYKQKRAASKAATHPPSLTAMTVQPQGQQQKPPERSPQPSRSALPPQTSSQQTPLATRSQEHQQVSPARTTQQLPSTTPSLPSTTSMSNATQQHPAPLQGSHALQQSSSPPTASGHPNQASSSATHVPSQPPAVQNTVQTTPASTPHPPQSSSNHQLPHGQVGATNNQRLSTLQSSGQSTQPAAHLSPSSVAKPGQTASRGYRRTLSGGGLLGRLRGLSPGKPGRPGGH